MKKYPYVKQTSLNNCGAAVVLMILKYYNGYMNLDKLSELLCIDNQGASAYHMVDVLNFLGFESAGYKYEVIESIKTPAIAHVKKDISTHYVVIYKINLKKKYLIVADPSSKIEKISFEDFKQIWTGIVIQMTPIRSIVKEKEPKPFKFIISLIKPCFIHFIIICILSFLISIFSIFNSFFIQSVIMYLKKNSLLFIVILYICTFLLKMILDFFKNNLSIKLNLKINEKLSMDTFKQILHLPYHYCRNKTAGEIVTYYNDLSLIQNLIDYLSTSIGIDLPIIILLSILFLKLDPHLLAINLFVISLYIIVHMILKNKKYYYTDEAMRMKSIVNSNIVESVAGYETIKNLNIENKMLKNFKNVYNKYLDLNQYILKLYNKENLFKNLIESISYILIVVYGIFSIRRGMSVELFISIFLLSNLYTNSFKNILNFSYEFYSLKAALSHIEELFYKLENKNITTSNGDITIKNLNYTFDNINKILKNINLKIKKGSKVLISGPSGSGKSTLFKIVKGYYDNFNGQALVGNKNSRENIFKNIKYVSQDEILFTGTVKNNIELNGQVKEDICEVSNFINNYDLVLQEDGFNLSGGQKQRIVLQRALSNFDILIIDEGLSQVDINMERRILKKILEKYKTKTVIYISHRLDNLDLFERMIRLNNGEVVLDEVYND